MKAQHTPGPWYERHGQISSLNSTHGCTIANCNATARGIPAGVVEANATLIAAAPDLLAACRCALADMEGSYSREDWDDDENPVALTIRELIAAIAKAEGQCEACSTGAMAGPIPGTLSNGERCDACERYENDEAARAAIAKAGGDK